MEKRRAVYLHEEQRHFIQQRARSWLWRYELPTWTVIIAVYSGWFATLANWQSLGLWPATLLLIVFTCWYLSVQHELIHGHPTRWPWFNQLLGLLPLAVWYPYGLYRDSHLAHHNTPELTLPHADPESYYFAPQRWQRFSRVQRDIIRLRNTFPGRLLLAPLLDIGQLLAVMMTAFYQRQRKAIVMWLMHGVLLAALFMWMAHCDFSPLWFVLAVSYPALAVTKIRSFLEHQAADDPLARSVINEAALPWRILFLNLNYHSIHHDLPGVPWYGLRTLYLRDRQAYRQRNRGFLVRGYSEWLRRFLFTSVDVNAHPGCKQHYD
ncbi:fatty acid desaturase [Kosakonia sp. H7A]|uniref:fatty acid desaturase n=1 Tax=Kosakonia sp. H7A TaxID=2054598 RepID=UPI000D16B3D7|nr:fatty acid desaturase [Kosakonia sp. H7A]PTA93617.1 fatty acid desaturase [Kosakonia sp. H7A]